MLQVRWKHRRWHAAEGKLSQLVMVNDVLMSLLQPKPRTYVIT